MLFISFGGGNKIDPFPSNPMHYFIPTELLADYKTKGLQAIDPKNNPEGFIGSRVAKIFFGTNLYLGTVNAYSDSLWRVNYDDGDEEEYEEAELLDAVKLYEESKDSKAP